MVSIKFVLIQKVLKLGQEKLSSPKIKKNQVVTLGLILLITLYPHFDNELKVGTKTQIGFDDLVLNIIKKSNKIIKCKVIQSGLIESNKGVHFEKSKAKYAYW